MTAKILWISRHEPLASQQAELKRLFGEDVDIRIDGNPFRDASDIQARMRETNADAVVCVAPISVLKKLTEHGILPLVAEMAIVPKGDPRAEVEANGSGGRAGRKTRYYRFVRFQRLTGVEMRYEDVLPWR